jgi:murein L,D-transpeptidase YafK
MMSGVFLAALVVAAWWVCAIRPTRPRLPGVRADRVLVRKAARRLVLMRQGRVLKSYRMALGGQPGRPKECEGDQRTPEGKYVIDRRNPRSAFHLSLHISYPDQADVSRAAERGVSPGGDVMIHGLRNGYGWLGPLHRLRDWTTGCIAVTNLEIEEIWNAVPDGTEIEIVP